MCGEFLEFVSLIIESSSWSIFNYGCVAHFNTWNSDRQTSAL